MKRSLPFKLYLFLLPILSAALTESAAQSESEWSVSVYDHGLNALVELSPCGGYFRHPALFSLDCAR